MKNENKIKVSLNIGGKRVRKAVQNHTQKESVNKQEETIAPKLELDKIESQHMIKEQRVSVTENKENSKRNHNKSRRIRGNHDDLTVGIEIVNKNKEKAKVERDKRIGKTLVEVKEELQVVELKRRSGLKTGIISCLLILLVVVLYLFLEYGPIFGFSLVQDQGMENNIEIITTDSDIYKMYDQELLVYSNQKLTTYNKNSKVTWQYSLDQMFTPEIYIQDAYIVVANNTNGTIYLFENKREILNKKIEGTIRHIYLDDKGNMAIEYSTSGYKKIIGVYDKQGKNLYNSYLENDAISDIKLLENANKLLIAQTNASSFKVDTILTMIDGTKTNDNVRQIIKLDNNLLYDLTIQARDIIILVDNEIMSINMDTGEKKTIKTFDASQMLFIHIADNYYTSVEKQLNNATSTYEMITARFDGTNISKLDIKNSPKMMINSGLLNYFIFQDGYRIVNKWGIEVKKQTLELVPKESIVFNHEKSVALVYTNKISIVNI